MEKISEAITIFLLNACWQIVFIWLASLSAARMMRKMPMRFQHNLWAFSLVLCFLIPFAGVFRSQILGFFVGSPIISSTVAKKFLGLEKSLGTIEKGKSADLVLLDANPLNDIANTKKISAVIVSGRYLAKEKLQEMLRSNERR